MKSLTRTIRICVLLLTTALSSCDKLIETKPVSVITGDNFWKSQDDATGALNGMYAKLRNEAQQNLYFLGEARSEVMDDANISGNSYPQYYRNEMSGNFAGPSWFGLYATIDAANQIITYVPNINFTDQKLKNRVLAEAYTMRAFMYFIITRTWGEAIIRKEPTEKYDAEKIFLPRSSKTEVFDLIKLDIEEAIKLYPDDNFTGERARWSLAGALTLKADVYLWTGKVLNGGEADFRTALEACEKVENADLRLLDNFADIFDYSNKGNKEIIMGVRFRNLESPNNYFHEMWVGAGRYPSPIDEKTREILGMGGTAIVWAPSELVRNQFHQKDKRRDASFFEVYTLENGDKNYFATVVLKGKGMQESGVRHFKDDIVLYRYADLLLMKAEAKNALSQDPSAEINLIRRRAFGENFQAFEYKNDTRSANDQAILKERLLELAFEGKRWWDLIRFDEAFNKVPSLQGKKSETHLLLFPIANSVLSMEPKVQQNKGY